MKKFLIQIVLTIALIAIFFACGSKPQEGSVLIPSLCVLVFESEYGGYGYNVYRNDSCLIHQPHIPTISGTQGFRTRLQAQQVALTVLEKIERGEFPPTLKHEDLDSLGINLTNL